MDNQNKVLREIIKEGMGEILSRLLLTYYHYYKTDEDSLLQIYNSLLEFFILNGEDAKEVYKDVINKLEKNYFYKIDNYNPLKIKSSI